MKVDEKIISEIASIMKLEFSKEETTELTQEINETLTMLNTMQKSIRRILKGLLWNSQSTIVFLEKMNRIQDIQEVESLLENAIDSEENQIKVQRF